MGSVEWHMYLWPPGCSFKSLLELQIEGALRSLGSEQISAVIYNELGPPVAAGLLTTATAAGSTGRSASLGRLLPVAEPRRNEVFLVLARYIGSAHIMRQQVYKPGAMMQLCGTDLAGSST